MNRVGLLAAAEPDLRKALELEPGRPTTELNLATNLSLRGKWRAGWSYYEARLRMFNVIPEMPHHRWDGTPPRDRLLLLRTEQGMGDEDTPGYPHMRLFRQRTLGDREGVFGRIAPLVEDTMKRMPGD